MNTMLEIDYPANHSMDTLWFAVDQVGHVAALFSGETGPAPRYAGDVGLPGFLRHVPGVPPEVTEGEDCWSDTLDEPVHEYGLFRYEANEEALLPLQPQYERTGTPANPLHVDQLPPEARELAKKHQFDSFRFADRKIIQIFEHMQCRVDSEFMAGYLCADGKTVKPIPGKEKDFTRFVERLRKDYPAESADLHFESVEPAPPKKPSRKRKKRDG
jgi:hypothetical protein